MNNSTVARICSGLLVALLAATPLIAGCGKKGWPQPRNTNDTFKWIRASAAPANEECIRFEAELNGNLRNIEYIALELQTAGSAEDCPTCPFNPNERMEYLPEELGITSQQGAFSRLYCPKRKSSAYRWRFVGVNVHGTLEHAISTVRGVEME
ncbi:hypothetical protein N1030_04785 [Desulfovibrio mangrovi]|uniref:hypothetical protein n=1 Tax=Desulfovibrio mangrovi TaxID=2976983 RepID=UPI0022455948|nr:hypothetical protein [Desulfovibrio mangrovi]UZP68299.1 hypothetical protein N1030_04785 [Desulfovibrio mangrovi]